MKLTLKGWSDNVVSTTDKCVVTFYVHDDNITLELMYVYVSKKHIDSLYNTFTNELFVSKVGELATRICEKFGNLDRLDEALEKSVKYLEKRRWDSDTIQTLRKNILQDFIKDLTSV